MKARTAKAVDPAPKASTAIVLTIVTWDMVSSELRSAGGAPGILPG